MKTKLTLLASLLLSTVVLANETEKAEPAKHEASHATAHSTSVEKSEHLALEAGPQMSTDAGWLVVPLCYIIGGIFVAAMVVGPIARMNAPEPLPEADAHGHDDHGHGHDSHGHGHDNHGHGHDSHSHGH